MKKPVFRLRELWHVQADKWLVAWLLGAVTLLAAVALLAVSGWFISAAALAGMAAMATAFTFDYFRPAAIIRALAIIRTAGRYGERLASHHAVLALLRDLRIRLFAHLTRSSDRQRAVSAQTMHRLIGDVELLDNLPLRFFMPWLWALLLQTAFVLWLWVVSPRLAAISVVPLLLAGTILPAVAVWQGKQWARQDADQAEQRRALLLEPLPMMTSLLLWQRWQDCQQAFMASDRSYSELKRQQQYRASVYIWLQQCLLAVMATLLIWQALPLLQNGMLGVPLLLAMVLAVLGLGEVLSPLVQQFMAYGFAVAARDRLNDLVTPEVQAVHGHTSTPVAYVQVMPSEHILTAENLCAKQPGALNGVENVSFALPRGQALVMRGQSGCGKSTLLDVLAGELHPESGRLKMDDQPYRFESVNYLAQQIDIFDLSLAENLRLGDANITDDDLWQVLAQVQLADWAAEQPEKLQTPLGEYGAAVSGGQARRIALARLLLRPKPVLLLDEPFAGLDETTRNRLWASLRDIQRDGWLVVASHHLPLSHDYAVLDLPAAGLIQAV